MTLVDVRKDDYIGTDTPRNYSSDIVLNDPTRNVADREVKIWMNNPLRFAGETFYQSDYFKDMRTGRGDDHAGRGHQHRLDDSVRQLHDRGDRHADAFRDHAVAVSAVDGREEWAGELASVMDHGETDPRRRAAKTFESGARRRKRSRRIAGWVLPSAVVTLAAIGSFGCRPGRQ